ncbi:MAG: rRNA maturation RNase YbeY [Candidatus Baltobacteraceae bacterium]
MIHYRNDVRGSGVDARALKRTMETLLAALGEGGSGISVTLVDDAAIRALNRDHRGKDAATDVLSFPMFDGTSADPHIAERLLGDIVISIDTARRQAADYDAPLQRELYRLLIHGLLHVMGHDHMKREERAEMEAEERRLAAAIRMPWPYEL